MIETEFFAENYQELRSFPPMKWMRRMFLRLVDGKPPSLVDLITGAGKTDLIVIWLIALAWHAKNRDATKPLPRRLVWVVNRRVLVQQVYVVAEELDRKLKAPSGSAAKLATLLRTLCSKQDAETVFNIIQLRGQRLDDREWSLNPTMPQLIIGTVDHIGSRLLFQGYGQGKWARPMHAALFGVDAWICVDEAHLVPAFAVTLRQVREIAARPLAVQVPESISRFFDRLPFWITELSATPGLPAPLAGEVFRLEKEKGDYKDKNIIARLRAKQTRRVIWKPQPEKNQIARDMATEALRIAKDQPGSTIPVFCCTAKDADAIGKELKKKHPNRVLLVTGRIRGYERDRLEQNPLFKPFRQPHPEAPATDDPPTFLVGTAAAEVGLDADASAIVCDFASLPTLLQRLGRLDRRGQLSRRAHKTNAEPPTMTIIGGTNGKTTTAQLAALVTKLNSANASDGSEFRTEFFTGAPWSLVVGKEKTEDDNGDDAPEAAEPQEETGNKAGVEDAIATATWQVLNLSSTPSPLAEARQPAAWLTDPLATITSGPVVVPPLTESVLRRWTATTPPPSRFLPVHPWLYGLLPDDEGTPLVGIAFRLELDVLRFHSTEDEDDEDNAAYDREWQKVSRCLTAFPPLNSELHFVPLKDARAWLEAHSADEPSVIVHFDGDEWTDSVAPEDLSAKSVLVLPTSTNPKLLEDIIPPGGDEKPDQRCWDVFEALAKESAKYRREVKISSGTSRLKAGDPEDQDVYRVGDTGDDTQSTESEETANDVAEVPVPSESDPILWKKAGIKLSFSHGGIAFDLRYIKPNRGTGNALDFLRDHLRAAAEHGKKLAEALAPGDAVLAALLGHSGQQHDIGKDYPKWQQAMGNTPTWREREGRGDSIRIAKPVIENPGKAGGYRHEWGTLWTIHADPFPIAEGMDTATAAFLRDLHLHVIAAHHGYFRPSMPDRGFSDKPTAAKQNPLRMEAIERAARLQRLLGCWRLAYLETLVKVADVSASKDTASTNTEETPDED